MYLSVDVRGSCGNSDVGNTFLLSDQRSPLPRFNQDLRACSPKHRLLGSPVRVEGVTAKADAARPGY